MTEKENILIDSGEILKELTYDFESNVGALSINLETLDNINTELGYIAEDFRNTNVANLTDMGLMFRDVNHKVRLLSDLLRYTVNELEGNIDSGQKLNGCFFDIIVRKGLSIE